MTAYRQSASKVRSRYPFYDWACSHVPGYKTVAGNTAFRRLCIEKAVKSSKDADELWIMCSRDMLFFVNTFCFTYDPRLVPKSTVVPFITYDFQDVALDDIKCAIEGGYDELSEKSRDMGASWMYLTVYTWFWLFSPYQSFRLISRNADLVDKAEDPDCLFWKVMFILKRLPSFLLPRYTKNIMMLKNEDNDSTITGCTTTGDAARGGRCTSMLIDEMAAIEEGDALLSSTRDVTRCRLFNSTHKGAGTAFYRLSVGNIRKLRLHWSLHPVKGRGLYYFTKQKELVRLDDFAGEVRVGDKVYKFPDEYPFRDDGKLRSPWYDNECDRAAHPMEIAQELDMDPFASDFQYFDGSVIAEIEKRDVRPPFKTVDLEFDADTLEPLELTDTDGAKLKLWIYPDTVGRMPAGASFAMGIDISAGTGASNSAISVNNLKTGEKVAEFADPWIKPESFAKYAVALAKLFNDAYMIWDGGGPGRTFGDEVINLGYRNIYYRRNEKSLSKKISDIPGCFLTPDEKKSILGAYRKDLKEGNFTQRSREANAECLAYIYTTRNTIEHSEGAKNIDPSGAKDNHGDRVIADALVNKARALLGAGKTAAQPPEIPANCYKARLLQRQRREKEKAAW